VETTQTLPQSTLEFFCPGTPLKDVTENIHGCMRWSTKPEWWNEQGILHVWCSKETHMCLLHVQHISYSMIQST